MKTTHRGAAVRAAATLTVAAALGAPAAATAAPGGAQHEDEDGAVAAVRGMSVRLTARPGPGGALVHVRARGFRFAPAAMAPDHERPWPHTPGQGHLHLYANGEERPVTLLVAPWTFVRLPAGLHRLRVTLNADTHAEYQRRGRPIEATATVRVAR